MAYPYYPPAPYPLTWWLYAPLYDILALTISLYYWYFYLEVFRYFLEHFKRITAEYLKPPTPPK